MPAKKEYTRGHVDGYNKAKKEVNEQERRDRIFCAVLTGVIANGDYEDNIDAALFITSQVMQALDK